MAAKIDLTFEELNDALGGSAIALSGDDIMISVKNVTGDSKDALTNDGVIELVYKLSEACRQAQNTANESLESGERLNSFSGGTFSPPADGLVTVTFSQTVQIPLNTATVVGTNL